MICHKLLTVGQLIDGTGAPPQPNSGVLIAGDRTKAVFPHPPAGIDESVETHAFPKGTLLLGMLFNSFIGSLTSEGCSELGCDAGIAVVKTALLLVFAVLSTRAHRAIDYQLAKWPA